MLKAEMRCSDARLAIVARGAPAPFAWLRVPYQQCTFRMSRGRPGKLDNHPRLVHGSLSRHLIAMRAASSRARLRANDARLAPDAGFSSNPPRARSPLPTLGKN